MKTQATPKTRPKADPQAKPKLKILKPPKKAKPARDDRKPRPKPKGKPKLKIAKAGRNPRKRNVYRPCQRPILAAIAKASRGLTDTELAAILGCATSKARSYRSTLAACGYVATNGSTRMTPSGRSARVWTATEQGRNQLARTKPE